MYNMHPRLRHELLDRLVNARLVHLDLSCINCLDHSAKGDRLPDLLRLEPNPSVEPNSGLERNVCGERRQQGVFWAKQSAVSSSDLFGTHCLQSCSEHSTISPPLSSPNPSALPVAGSTHSISGSMSRFAIVTRA